tara:strand:- start:225 stop:524 length:300 start_codon:yes stop_codon:yes gene_type:complete
MDFDFPGLLAQTDVWSRGLAIAASGLVIVFAVLILLSLFIAALPHMIGALSHVLPELDHGRADQTDDGSGHPDSQLPDDVVVAAIGFVLHTEMQKQAGN